MAKFKTPEVQLEAANLQDAQARLKHLLQINESLTTDQLRRVANAAKNPITRALALKHLP